MAKTMLTRSRCARKGCLKDVATVAWELGHLGKSRKFGTLVPGLSLGGLGISRARLMSKLYSGSLQTSTFCLGLSLEIFLQRYVLLLILGVAKLPPKGRFQLCICWHPGDSLCVLLQEKAKDEEQGYGRRSSFSFHPTN